MRVIIIEDEIKLRNTNKILLQRNFPDVEIVGETGELNQAITLLRTLNPDLVLFDVEIKGGNCFQILQKCKDIPFQSIFITAHDKYAVKAIKFNALDYILKPVNEFELCDAVNKAMEKINHQNSLLQRENLVDQYMSNSIAQKMVLRTSENLLIRDIKDIDFCQSDNSYTSFYMSNGERVLVSKSIKEYADLLSEHQFIRPHQSYLVNINAIEKIDKTDGGFIILKNQKEIPISQRRKKDILDYFAKI